MLLQSELVMEENLTAEKLARFPPNQILETILIKAGVISFKRVARIIKDTFIVAKVENYHSKEDLFQDLCKYCFYLPEMQIFVTKSSLVFDAKTNKRGVAIRDYLISLLVKGPIKKVELKEQVMDVVSCDF